MKLKTVAEVHERLVAVSSERQWSLVLYIIMIMWTIEGLGHCLD